MRFPKNNENSSFQSIKISDFYFYKNHYYNIFVFGESFHNNIFYCNFKLDIMNIHEAINIIKEQASLCEQNREKFDLPDISDAKVIINDLPNQGADLLHREYKIFLADGENIHIDYHSKDKCRVFQINPDRSVISVKCSQPELNFDDYWDEKY